LATNALTKANALANIDQPLEQTMWEILDSNYHSQQAKWIRDKTYDWTNVD